MKLGFYPRLALDGIRKNKRLYVPYLLTCVGMIMMFYIVYDLQESPAVAAMRGGEMLQTILGLGAWVIGVFSCLFLFYTNAFLIRRRKKEFGLYSILGMGKRNISRILLWETVMIYALSLLVGLTLGVAFSKLMEMGLIRLMNGTADFAFTVSLPGLGRTAMLFGGIFLLLFLNALRQVRFSSAISLVRSENLGEKPPRANWFLGLLGVVLLGAAYYLALTIQDPVVAITLFFVAVLLVILGTYLVMIAGSVTLCRFLQKRKRFYYRPNHFVSVSSMVYRMKRNGAGLASICILATMVLVMISTTFSLYAGMRETVNRIYPHEIMIEAYFDPATGGDDEWAAQLRQDLEQLVLQDVTPEDETFFRALQTYGARNGSRVVLGQERMEQEASGYCTLFFVPLQDYNRQTGSSETLERDEVLIYSPDGWDGTRTLEVKGGPTYRVKKTVATFPMARNRMAAITELVVIVPDFREAAAQLLPAVDPAEELTGAVYEEFDTGLGEAQQKTLYQTLADRLGTLAERYDDRSFRIDNRLEHQEDYFGMYGGLFYLGIVLSIVFLFAAVLMIYYKQISEGYEDQGRFDIMQKVGMTRREIRRSINSQLLLVFFLPLLGAGMHLAFAFPMIEKMLRLFSLDNIGLFAAATLVCFALFAVFYTLVYRVTSNAYYQIVSGARGWEA